MRYLTSYKLCDKPVFLDIQFTAKFLMLTIKIKTKIYILLVFKIASVGGLKKEPRHSIYSSTSRPYQIQQEFT